MILHVVSDQGWLNTWSGGQTGDQVERSHGNPVTWTASSARAHYVGEPQKHGKIGFIQTKLH